jgi:hypothetical protein
MRRRAGLYGVLTLAIAAMTAASAFSTEPARSGSLYVVNYTKRAMSLAVDGETAPAASTYEVQGRAIVSGSHILHFGADGLTLDLPVTLDRDHVAVDERGLAFWCAIAAIDVQGKLRAISTSAPDCAKLVALGLHHPPPGGPPDDPVADLVVFDVTDDPIKLTLDSGQPVEIAGHQVFGRTTPSGAHELHLDLAGQQSVDVHLNLDTAALGRDSAGRGYWCVGVARVTSGFPTAVHFKGADCTKYVGAGRPPTSR